MVARVLKCGSNLWANEMSFEMQKDTMRDYTSSCEFLIIARSALLLLHHPSLSFFFCVPFLLRQFYKELHGSKFVTQKVVFV